MKTTGRLYLMSQEELNRLAVIEKIISGHLTQKRGAAELKLSPRQLRRLQERHRECGPAGLLSRRRGRSSNNRIPEPIREQVIHLLREHYPDFGPTFAHEKLTEQHGFSFSVEWLRQLMLKNGLWQDKRAKPTRTHQSRARRPSVGELVQIDGSPHAWFEERAPACCLIVFVDDASSQIMALHFSEKETTQAYFMACQQHIQRHGRPLSYYSDKFSVFRVNHKEAGGGSGETQFGRAARELGIELICANSPQAKGRVEKMNRTLQDRLTKEMRLRGISDISTANAFLPEFIEDYNRRFAKTPASSVNAHRLSIPDKQTLKLIFSQQHTRKLSKSLEMSYQNVLYQIQTQTPSYAMRGATVTVCDHQGVVTLLYKNRALHYKTLDKKNQPATVSPRKTIAKITNTKRPSTNHPWKKYPSGFSKKTLVSHA